MEKTIKTTTQHSIRLTGRPCGPAPRKYWILGDYRRSGRRPTNRTWALFWALWLMAVLVVAVTCLIVHTAEAETRESREINLRGWEESAYIRDTMAGFGTTLEVCGLWVTFPGLDDETALISWMREAIACVEGES